MQVEMYQPIRWMKLSESDKGFHRCRSNMVSEQSFIISFNIKYFKLHKVHNCDVKTLIMNLLKNSVQVYKAFQDTIIDPFIFIDPNILPYFYI